VSCVAELARDLVCVNNIASKFRLTQTSRTRTMPPLRMHPIGWPLSVNNTTGCAVLTSVVNYNADINRVGN